MLPRASFTDIDTISLSQVFRPSSEVLKCYMIFLAHFGFSIIRNYSFKPSHFCSKPVCERQQSIKIEKNVQEALPAKNWNTRSRVFNLVSFLTSSIRICSIYWYVTAPEASVMHHAFQYCSVTYKALYPHQYHFFSLFVQKPHSV